jgi:aspartate/methionine/tyrosine aminotransferase
VTLGRIEDFALERYFARWEFAVKHQLSASDVEPFTLAELLALADDDGRRRWERLGLGYTESAGHPMLRAEIAHLYERLAPEHVLVCAGAEEAIFLAMHALLAPGDPVVVVTPAYQSLHEIARSIGAQVTTVPLRADRAWHLDPEEVARAVRPGTRLIVINFPHSPTGSHIDAGVQRRLLEIAENSGAVLFSDEVYRGLEHPGAQLLTPAADLSTTAVSLGVMSKSFALPGLRIGWLATRNSALLDKVVRLKDYTTICSSAPSEILAIIALRARDRVLGRSRAIVGENVAAARDFIASHSHEIEWTPPRAGSVAFPRFRSRDAEDVSRELAEHQSALLIPGHVFGAESSHFRLGLGRRGLPAALERLGRVLENTRA